MPLAAHEFGVVQRLMLEVAAIALSDEQAYLVESRLTSLAKQLGSDLSTVVRRLDKEPMGELHQRVIDVITTNETSFFRDRALFEGLSREVFAQLMLRRVKERRLRIWCAACSSGQEAFSLAMLLAETYPTTQRWDVKILGTDLSSAMIRRAREASYSQLETSRGLPPAYLARYFDRDGSNLRVKPELRKLVEFRQMNLARPEASPGAFDLILLRNVLIYFTPATRAQVLSHARSSLRKDGYLCLGATESPQPGTGFIPFTLKNATIYAREDSGLTPLRRPKLETA